MHTLFIFTHIYDLNINEYIHIHKRTHTRTHTDTHIHTYAHTHIHVLTDACALDVHVAAKPPRCTLPSEENIKPKMPVFEVKVKPAPDPVSL
jgi:hypothetical protein